MSWRRRKKGRLLQEYTEQREGKAHACKENDCVCGAGRLSATVLSWKSTEESLTPLLGHTAILGA